MNLNLDFAYDYYKNNTKNYSSNVKSYTMPTTSISSSENKKINSTATDTTSTVTEIPVLSNEVYNRMFISNNYKNMNILGKQSRNYFLIHLLWLAMSFISRI